MNDATQKFQETTAPRRFFQLAGWSAILSALMLFSALFILPRTTASEDAVESLALISLAPAIPAALALSQVRRPAALTWLGVASAITWGIVLGSIALNFYDPSLVQELTRLFNVNILLWIVFHLIWTTWAGYLFLSGRLTILSN
jgi:hypothetical protein